SSESPGASLTRLRHPLPAGEGKAPRVRREYGPAQRRCRTAFLLPPGEGGAQRRMRDGPACRVVGTAPATPCCAERLANRPQDHEFRGCRHPLDAAEQALQLDVVTQVAIADYPQLAAAHQCFPGLLE